MFTIPRPILWTSFVIQGCIWGRYGLSALFRTLSHTVHYPEYFCLPWRIRALSPVPNLNSENSTVAPGWHEWGEQPDCHVTFMKYIAYTEATKGSPMAGGGCVLFFLPTLVFPSRYELVWSPCRWRSSYRDCHCQHSCEKRTGWITGQEGGGSSKDLLRLSIHGLLSVSSV
jgi:hypothetical protein